MTFLPNLDPFLLNESILTFSSTPYLASYNILHTGTSVTLLYVTAELDYILNKDWNNCSSIVCSISILLSWESEGGAIFL